VSGGPRLGAHMSIAGGLPSAVERARRVEATALQVFVKSANQWRARDLAEGEVEAFRGAAGEAGLSGHLTAHSTYLINLASPDEALWEKSIAAFVEELRRCAALAIPHLVVHPGSHMGAGEAAGIARVAGALDRALRAEPSGAVSVLLEITAGQGRCLGGTFEEVARILDAVRERDRVGACFDTCHALAAGYEFRDAPSYRETFARWDATIGLERLRAFHLNDSKGALGSRTDRHAHIGRGEVGLEAFRLLLNDPRFAALPMVIETEKQDDLEDDRRNLAVLRSLVGR
jgi:deoxyribonuclease-4